MKLLLLISAPFLLYAQEAPPVVGSIKIARGSVTVHRGTSDIVAMEGAHLQAHDSLRTGANGALGIILQDGTRVSMGPNTVLEIDRFVYEPASGTFGMLLRLTRGVIAYISGKMAEFSPASIRVETPVGIVGLRGTEMAISLEGA